MIVTIVDWIWLLWIKMNSRNWFYCCIIDWHGCWFVVSCLVFTAYQRLPYSFVLHIQISCIFLSLFSTLYVSDCCWLIEQCVRVPSFCTCDELWVFTHLRGPGDCTLCTNAVHIFVVRSSRALSVFSTCVSFHHLAADMRDESRLFSLSLQLLCISCSFPLSAFLSSSRSYSFF